MDPILEQQMQALTKQSVLILFISKTIQNQIIDTNSGTLVRFKDRYFVAMCGHTLKKWGENHDLLLYYGQKDLEAELREGLGLLNSPQYIEICKTFLGNYRSHPDSESTLGKPDLGFIEITDPLPLLKYDRIFVDVPIATVDNIQANQEIQVVGWPFQSMTREYKINEPYSICTFQTVIVDTYEKEHQRFYLKYDDFEPEATKHFEAGGSKKLLQEEPPLPEGLSGAGVWARLPEELNAQGIVLPQRYALVGIQIGKLGKKLIAMKFKEWVAWAATEVESL